MKIVGLQHVAKFVQQHPDSKGPLETLIALIRDAEWKMNTDIRQISGSASFLGDQRVVFNIKGPKYRLDLKVDYRRKNVQIIRIGTHVEYNKWKF